MKIAAALLTLALAWAPAAHAHTDEANDAQKTAHGGQMRSAGVWHFELVLVPKATLATEQPVIVYVTDHNNAKIDTAGAKGSVTLLSGKEKSVVTLAPDGANRLKGVGRYAAAPNLKAVASITLAGKPAEQARFTPFAGTAGEAKADSHAGH